MDGSVVVLFKEKKTRAILHWPNGKRGMFQANSYGYGKNVFLSTVDQVQTAPVPWKDSRRKVRKQLYDAGVYPLYTLSGK